MNFNVHLTDTFQRSLKALKKKYPGIKEITALLKNLEEELGYAYLDEPPL